MALSDIVQVTITSNSRGISRVGFGTPLVVGVTTNIPGLTKVYTLGTAAIDLVTDGFGTRDPIYLAVTALARNTPKPRNVIVGKLLTDFDQTFDLTVKTIVALGGELFEFTITSPDGTITTITYTATVADTETIIATALNSQITAIADLTSTPTAGVMAVAADNSSEMFFVDGLDVTIMDFEDTTVDSSLVAELAAVTANNPDWYGLILADPNSNARVTVLANSIETQEKIFGYTTHDTAVGDPGSVADVMFDLNALTLFRTYGIYSGDQGAYAAATWMGNRFPSDPGSSTWAFKPLSGVTVDNLETAFSTAILDKSGNTFETVAGLTVTQNGTMASGEFIDVIRGRDWLTQRMRERVFGLLANAEKVPYTNGGIAQVTAEVEAQLSEGVNATYLSPDPLTGVAGTPAFTVTAPLASEVSSADKIARLLPDVAFTATLAGAIHAVQINGVIEV